MDRYASSAKKATDKDISGVFSEAPASSSSTIDDSLSRFYAIPSLTNGYGIRKQVRVRRSKAANTRTNGSSRQRPISDFLSKERRVVHVHTGDVNVDNKISASDIVHDDTEDTDGDVDNCTLHATALIKKLQPNNNICIPTAQLLAEEVEFEDKVDMLTDSLEAAAAARSTSTSSSFLHNYVPAVNVNILLEDYVPKDIERATWNSSNGIVTVERGGYAKKVIKLSLTTALHVPLRREGEPSKEPMRTPFGNRLWDDQFVTGETKEQLLHRIQCTVRANDDVTYRSSLVYVFAFLLGFQSLAESNWWRLYDSYTAYVGEKAKKIKNGEAAATWKKITEELDPVNLYNLSVRVISQEYSLENCENKYVVSALSDPLLAQSYTSLLVGRIAPHDAAAFRRTTSPMYMALPSCITRYCHPIGTAFASQVKSYISTVFEMSDNWAALGWKHILERFLKTSAGKNFTKKVKKEGPAAASDGANIVELPTNLEPDVEPVRPGRLKAKKDMAAQR